MTVSTGAYPLKSLRHHRNAMAAGGPRWKRLLERQRLSAEAMAVARPFNDMLVTLEAQIVELGLVVDRNDYGAPHPRSSVRASRLGRSVYFQQLAFADLIGALAPSISSNERIGDTRKALNRAAAAVEFIQKKLANYRGSARIVQ